jgi:hypothetical protein
LQQFFFSHLHNFWTDLQIAVKIARQALAIGAFRSETVPFLERESIGVRHVAKQQNRRHDPKKTKTGENVALPGVRQ